MALSLDAAAEVFREAMRDTVKRYSLWYLIQGGLLIAAGVLAIIYPVLFSARWWCFCRLKDAPGLTMMRLTWKRGPMSMLSYQPQGRCTLRCNACSARPPVSRRLTSFLTSWLRSRSCT